MKSNKLIFALLFLAGLNFTACDNVSDPQASTVTTIENRLIFTGYAESGAYIKVELSDTHIESLLDGNNSGVTTPLLIPSSLTLPAHSSLATITLTDINYYGKLIPSVTCSSDPDNKLSLVWVGPLGDYYEGPNGYLYLDDILMGSQYVLQGSSETLNEAVIVSYYYSDCVSDDGSSFRVSFYPRTDVLSHSIETTFSVDEGTIKGIVRLHRVGDGYTPYIDLLF